MVYRILFICYPAGSEETHSHSDHSSGPIFPVLKPERTDSLSKRLRRTLEDIAKAQAEGRTHGPAPPSNAATEPSLSTVVTAMEQEDEAVKELALRHLATMLIRDSALVGKLMNAIIEGVAIGQLQTSSDAGEAVVIAEQLLRLKSGSNPSTPTGEAAQEALAYVDFAKSKGSAPHPETDAPIYGQLSRQLDAMVKLQALQARLSARIASIHQPAALEQLAPKWGPTKSFNNNRAKHTVQPAAPPETEQMKRMRHILNQAAMHLHQQQQRT